VLTDWKMMMTMTMKHPYHNTIVKNLAVV